MAENLHILVVYDVTADRRRARLARKLDCYLNRVQKSVFEGVMPADRLPRLKDTIRRVVNLDNDNVRIYRLCGRCVSMVEVVGTAVWTPGPLQDEVL